MSEEPQRTEKQPQKDLETFEEKLDFLVTRFVTKTKPIKDIDEADVVFGGELFSGKLDDNTKQRVSSGLNIDLDSGSDFRLTGNFDFQVWLIPESDPSLYLLRQDIDDEVDLVLYEGNLLEMFELAEGLRRVE